MHASLAINSRLKTLVVLHAIPLSFSTNVVLGRALNTSVEPATLAFYRWFIAALLLVVFTGHLLWKYRKELLAVYDLLLLLGFLGMFVCGAVFYAGLRQTEAINGALIYMSSPVMIILFEVMFRGQRLSLLKIGGVTAAIFGVAIILFGGGRYNLTDFQWRIGDLYCLAAAISWAIYSIILKTDRLSNLPTLALFPAIAIAGSFVLFPFYILEDGPALSFDFSVNIWLAIFTLASFSSALAFGFYQKGVELVGASTTSLYLYLLPVYSTVFATLLLGETLSVVHVAGFVLIAGGLYFSTQQSHQPPQKSA